MSYGVRYVVTWATAPSAVTGSSCHTHSAHSPCSDANVSFTGQLALKPAEVHIDLANQMQNEKELEEAAQLALPDGDEDLVE